MWYNDFFTDKNANDAKQKLIKEYLNADILFLHLNDYEAFQKVLPSKLFEYGAMNKPILAGISGYSKEFVKSEISNCAVFSAERKSGNPKATSASRTPTRVTPGISWPLATIWVPTRIRVSPSLNF